MWLLLCGWSSRDCAYVYEGLAHISAKIKESLNEQK